MTKTIIARSDTIRYPFPPTVDRSIAIFDGSCRRPVIVRIIADDEKSFADAADKTMRDHNGIKWCRY